MVSFRSALLALAGAAAVAAQTSTTCNANCFKVPDGGYNNVTAGASLTLNWTPSTTGTVSLLLRSGNSAYLSNGTVIASGLSNSGSYVWNIPADTPRGSAYAVEIISDADPTNTALQNYTPQFNIESTVLYASTSVISSATAVSTSVSGSVTVTVSSTLRSTVTGTSTTGTASASNSAGLQSRSNTGLAPRATAYAGLAGIVALGALAL